MSRNRLGSARRLASTVSHLLPQQVLQRPVRAIRRRFALPARAPNSVTKKWAPLNPHASFPASPGLLSARDRSAFVFLGRSIQLQPPIDWQSVGAPALWRYNLNYFAFLSNLSEDLKRELCDDWIRSNRPFGGIPWDAFPTSLRIVNWVKYAPKSEEIIRSLYVQADYLSRFTETHLLGNHLLENARALVFVGSFFRKASFGRRWLEQGLAIYRRQTPEQILADGGHYERSPMYHALMLEGYVDVANLLPVEHVDRPFFLDKICKMTRFMAATMHGDGDISLFNDSALGIAPRAADLIAYSKRVVSPGAECAAPAVAGDSGISAFAQTGYYVFRSDKQTVIIDGGPVGPDHLPAHAHADILSYELSRGATRWVVDSGVFEYAAGQMREYCRGTQAHNTIQVDDVDQIETWSSFRVGRRARPYGISFDSIGDGFSFRGVFGGYRAIVGDDIRIERRLSGSAESLSVVDTATGNGTHRITSFVHLNPEARVEQVDDLTVSVQIGSDRALFSSTGTPVSIGEGWYCPRFGERIANPVLVMQEQSVLPVEIGYSLQFATA